MKKSFLIILILGMTVTFSFSQKIIKQPVGPVVVPIPVPETGMVIKQPVGVKISKPLSSKDKSQVERLLKGFDPNTYSFTVSYLDAKGKTQTATYGKARGLGNVQLSNTRLIGTGVSAGTVNKNNIFAAATVNKNNIFVAATVNKNNIFVAATVNKNNIFVAGTVNENNIFRPSQSQLTNMESLARILAKY